MAIKGEGKDVPADISCVTTVVNNIQNVVAYIRNTGVACIDTKRSPVAPILPLFETNRSRSTDS